MHFFKSVLTASACLTSLALAAEPVAFTSWPSKVTSGKPVTLKWTGNPNTPAKIILRKGPANNLKDVKVLTPAAKGGSFTWVPDQSLPAGSNYAFQIVEDGQVNYSDEITVDAGPHHQPQQKANKLHGAMHKPNAAAQSSMMLMHGSSAMPSSSKVPASSSHMMHSSHVPAKTTTGSGDGATATQTSISGATDANSSNQPSETTGTQTGSASTVSLSQSWVVGALSFLLYNI